MRTVLLAASVLLAGCPIDRFDHIERPARFEVGLNSRHYSADPTTTAARELTPPAGNHDIDGTATSASFRFTMRSRWNTYMGAEAEAGTFARPGSNLAGGYGVIGASAPLHRLTLSTELAAGWRGLRDDVQDDDTNVGVLEPRVRGEMWLSPQVTFGATAGADLVGQHAWMAGFYFAVHSHSFNVLSPNR
ncbi:MAG TPA: hypothetical protein VMZ53_18440 [Kofleriaceae bacterium]|nr:hypothetical protein [Kofleriaceae bacterium]